MTDLDLIDIDRDEKKITVKNNRELYKTIKSGALLAVLPYEEILASVHTAADNVDPTLGWATELLTRLGIYCYYVSEWTVAHLVTIEASAASVTAAAASPTVATTNITTK